MRENRIYTRLQRGPIVGGLPVLGLFGLTGVIGIGLFIVKAAFGLWGSLVWLLAGCLVWSVMAFIYSQDPSWLSVKMMKFTAPFFDQLNSYRPGSKRVRIRKR